VSHDRVFLERTVEDVLVLGHGDAGADAPAPGRPGRARRVPGGFAAYEATRRRARRPGRVGGPAPAPASASAMAGPASTVVMGAAATADGASASTTAGSAVGNAGPHRAPRQDGRPSRTPSTLRHLMRRAESDMARLRERQATLEADLAAARGDHVALARIGEELSAVGADLAAAEESWLALAEEAEARGLTT
jgi:hypothetical protein